MSASEPNENSDNRDESAADSVADAKAILVMFVALVLFAVHFASGWTFDV